MHLNEDDTEDFETLKYEFAEFVKQFHPLKAPEGSEGYLVWPEKTDEIAELDEHLVWTVH